MAERLVGKHFGLGWRDFCGAASTNRRPYVRIAAVFIAAAVYFLRGALAGAGGCEELCLGNVVFFRLPVAGDALTLLGAAICGGLRRIFCLAPSRAAPFPKCDSLLDSRPVGCSCFVPTSLQSATLETQR